MNVTKGLISSVSSGSQGGSDNITLIENLVTSYIKKPSCIILLTVACESELHPMFYYFHFIYSNLFQPTSRTRGLIVLQNNMTQTGSVQLVCALLVANYCSTAHM